MSLQAYNENLEKIVNQVSSDKVLLISPAPVDEERQHNRTNRVLSQYADVVEEVAKETGSYFLNLYAEMIQERDYKRFVENDEKDGLHFGPEGYEYVAKLIGEKLKGFYKKQSDIALLFRISFVVHKLIDCCNLDRYFAFYPALTARKCPIGEG